MFQENFDIKYNICGKTLTGQPMCNPYRQSMRRTTLPLWWIQLELLEICFLIRLSSCWDFVINLNPVLLHRQYVSDDKSVQKLRWLQEQCRNFTNCLLLCYTVSYEQHCYELKYIFHFPCQCYVHIWKLPNTISKLLVLESFEKPFEKPRTVTW